MQYKIGYVAVTADFLHIGHIKFLKKAKAMCDELIVGIMTDDCVKQYKGKLPIMNYRQRKEVVESLKFVTMAVPQNTFEFPRDLLSWRRKTEGSVIFDSSEHLREGYDVAIPYTKNISSTEYKNENTDNSQLPL